MVDCCHHTVVTYEGIISYVYASVVLEFASGIDKNIFAEMDIFPEICLKRGYYSYRRMNLAASEFTKKCVSLHIGMGIGIIVEHQSLRFSITPVHKLVCRRTGRDCFSMLHHFKKFMQFHITLILRYKIISVLRGENTTCLGVITNFYDGGQK